MARCATCGTMILFGGRRRGALRYCNDDCFAEGSYLELADEAPPELLQMRVDEIRNGSCPQCGGEGPVDVHTSHDVWSAFVVTTWNSHPMIACRRCGNKAKIGAIARSGVLGWWGFPFGLLVTPFQIIRNFTGLWASDQENASDELVSFVRASIATQVLQSQTVATEEVQPDGPQS